MKTPKEIQKLIRDYFYPTKLPKGWLSAATQLAWWTFHMSAFEDKNKESITDLLNNSCVLEGYEKEYVWNTMKQSSGGKRNLF
jgi:hypothetical protein